MARRARPFGLGWDEVDKIVNVKCAHDGYRRLSGKPTHWREWQLQEHELVVQDHIQGRFQEAIAYFHFHPALILEMGKSGQSGSARLPTGHKVTWKIDGGIAQIKPSTYHPRFGVSTPNYCLIVKLTQSESKLLFRW